MAKIVAPAAVEEHAHAPAKKKGSKLGLVLIVLVCLLAAGAGFALPMFLHLDGPAEAAAETEKKPNGEPKQALVPFGNITVNVASGSLSRYVRAKITLVCDEKDAELVKTQLEKKKPILEDWVNGYLSDRTLEELHGSAPKNKLRRDIRDQFNARLFPDGSEKITELLIPELYFQ